VKQQGDDGIGDRRYEFGGFSFHENDLPGGRPTPVGGGIRGVANDSRKRRRVETLAHGGQCWLVWHEVEKERFEMGASQLADPVGEFFADSQFDQCEVSSRERTAEPFDEIGPGSLLDRLVPDIGPGSREFAQDSCAVAMERGYREGVGALLEQDGFLLMPGQRTCEQAEDECGWVLVHCDDRSDEDDPTETRK
jgi:hypothetical protein